MNPSQFQRLLVGCVMFAASLAPFAGFDSMGAWAQPPNLAKEERSEPQQTDERVCVMQTGLLAARLETGGAGRFACIFGHPAPATEEERQEARHRGHALFGSPTHIATIDLEAGKVLARHPIDGGIQQVLMDDRYVYWKPKSVNVVNRLPLTADPSLRQLPLRFAVEQMFLVGDDRLAIVLSEGTSTRIQVYNRESMARCPDDALSKYELKYSQRGYGRVVWQRGDAELHVTPRIIDQRTGKTKCFVDPIYGVPTLEPNADPTSTLVSLSAADTWWRRRFHRESVTLISGPILYQIPFRNWCVSAELPLHAGLAVSGASYNASRAIEIREVVHGKRVERVELPNLAVSGMVAKDGGIKFAGRSVVMAISDRLVVCQLDQAVLAQVAAPVRLLHPDTPLSSVDHPADIKLVAKGGTPPYRFAMERPIDGVAVDETTGHVRVDFPSIWKRRIENVSKGSQPAFQISSPSAWHRSHPNDTPEDVFEKYTGVEIPNGMFPTALPLSLIATDGSGQQDRVLAYALAMAPKHAIESANAANTAVRAAAMEKSVAAARARQPGSGSQSTLEERVADLEERMRRIEAKLDAALSRLDATKE